MAKRSKQDKKKREQSAEQQGFSGLSLGDLLAARGLASAAAAEPERPPEQDRAEAPKPDGTSEQHEVDLSAQAKLVLRRERKGRGGKTVTLVEGLQLDRQALEALARHLRRQLGCGSSVEGERIVLQGDQLVRAQEPLLAAGARKVVSGSG